MSPIFLKTIAFLTIVVLCETVKTAQRLRKIPEYQDVEAALESSRCAVREEIVNIRDVHPTLPSEAVFNPSCVLVRKCSGCCQSDRHECMPTSLYTTRIEISQDLVRLNRFYYIILNFTHHADCICQSPVNPTCIPHVCSESEIWNKDRCRCEARCAPQECGHRKEWDATTCRCQCVRCHPDRLVHSRFTQDESTCICVCRHASRNRTRCEKRRARFNLNKCTCLSRGESRGSGLTGR